MTRQGLSLPMIRDILMTVALVLAFVTPVHAQTNITAALASESQTPKAGSTVLLAIEATHAIVTWLLCVLLSCSVAHGQLMPREKVLLAM